MLFRLTFLLVAGLFLVMYFAPELPEDHRSARVAERTEAPERSAPESSSREATEAPSPDAIGPDGIVEESAPAPRNTARAEPESAPDAQPEPAGDADGTTDTARGTAPLVIEGLSGGDSAAALSLSERIRARVEAERTAQASDQGQAAPDRAPDATAGSAPPASGPGESRAQVVATAVNLRAGPSTANAVVGQVDFGDEVVLLGEGAPGWSRIRHPETGEDAFMASRFLQPLGN